MNATPVNEIHSRLAEVTGAWHGHYADDSWEFHSGIVASRLILDYPIKKVRVFAINEGVFVIIIRKMFSRSGVAFILINCDPEISTVEDRKLLRAEYRVTLRRHKTRFDMWSMDRIRAIFAPETPASDEDAKLLLRILQPFKIAKDDF